MSNTTQFNRPLNTQNNKRHLNFPPEDYTQKKTKKISNEIFSNSISPNDRPTTANLIQKYVLLWNKRKNDFNFNEKLNLNIFQKKLIEYWLAFQKPNNDCSNHLGFIEKLDLNQKDNPQIFVRADIHGDLKALIDNLIESQKRNLLDNNFKCTPNTHFIFLGDYSDRGPYSLHVLDLLISLSLENKNQVHLIRGNHENTKLNNQESIKSCSLFLQCFYESLPLSIYVSSSYKQDIKREYVQFTHGLLEPTVDLSPLLESNNPIDYLNISKERQLSDRIKNISPNDNPQVVLVKEMTTQILTQATNQYFSFYNWARINPKNISTTIIEKEIQNSIFSITHIHACLKVNSGDTHLLKKIYRGHDHQAFSIKYNNETIITTLPAAPRTNPNYTAKNHQKDLILLIKPNQHVKDWQEEKLYY